MSKRVIRSPFLVINPKAFLYGNSSLELALEADKLSEKYDIDIIFTAQYVDIPTIKEKVKHLILTTQHMDGFKPGPGMGKILPKALAEAGVEATFLNHAEHPLTIHQLSEAVKYAEKYDILTIICADSIMDAKMIAVLEPDVLLCEPTELIGTGKVSDDAYMEKTNKMVRELSPNSLILQAAGISSGADVKKAIQLGADGSGGTTGIVKAANPIGVVEDMLKELSQLKGGKS
ncbi:MAG: triose-phosphate isomerase [Enterococcaceae bacterium]|jgi:triosephosphate isomerase|nr:triose-phosphate isomerase [Enterococcaceae bacterium]MCI1919300.1 triose-phosphate isomerase [Enterococcaceae bacterium]